MDLDLLASDQQKKYQISMSGFLQDIIHSIFAESLYACFLSNILKF